MYLVKTPKLIKDVFSRFTWSLETDEKKLYITFDDGPIPKVTPWVLKTLKDFNAKATFFCVGDNVRKYPDVFHQVILEGHRVGNHTFNHLSGWKTTEEAYISNVNECSQYVKSNIFRPPYGKMRYRQAIELCRDYDIIMWDVLSGDFDLSKTKESCYEKVMRAVRPGSIVVFHDSLKAEHKLRYSLPRVLESLTLEGYTFETIPMELNTTRLHIENQFSLS